MTLQLTHHGVMRRLDNLRYISLRLQMQRYSWLIPLLFVALSARLFAQPVFNNIFPPEEFSARRAQVMAKLGDGVAILQGTTERPGEQPLRQSNQFFYLCG